MQSIVYCGPMSWCECQTRSISSVGTRKDVGDDAIRSRNLYRKAVFLNWSILPERTWGTYAWYRERACWSTTSSSSLSKKPGSVQPKPVILSMNEPWRITCWSRSTSVRSKSRAKTTYSANKIDREWFIVGVRRHNPLNAVWKVIRITASSYCFL